MWNKPYTQHTHIHTYICRIFSNRNIRHRCNTAQCSFIWPGCMVKKWMHLYEFMFECVRECKAVSFACSNANCSEMMAKRNRDTCRLKKMKIWFSHSEPKRNIHSTVSIFFFFLLSSTAISLNGLCHFTLLTRWREKTFSSDFVDLWFLLPNFPIRFRCAIADR